jgi:hypothetical protein
MYETNISIQDMRGRTLVHDLLVKLEIHVDHINGWHQLLSVEVEGVNIGRDELPECDPLHSRIWNCAQNAFFRGELDHLFESELAYRDTNDEHRTYVGSAA